MTRPITRVGAAYAILVAVTATILLAGAMPADARAHMAARGCVAA